MVISRESKTKKQEIAPTRPCRRLVPFEDLPNSIARDHSFRTLVFVFRRDGYWTIGLMRQVALPKPHIAAAHKIPLVCCRSLGSDVVVTVAGPVRLNVQFWTISAKRCGLEQRDHEATITQNMYQQLTAFIELHNIVSPSLQTRKQRGSGLRMHKFILIQQIVCLTHLSTHFQ